MATTIVMDDEKLIVKKYKLRSTGNQKASLEITLPREAIEREGRRLGVTEEEIENLIGVWHYNGFKGLYLDFEVPGKHAKNNSKKGN